MSLSNIIFGDYCNKYDLSLTKISPSPSDIFVKLNFLVTVVLKD